MFDVLVIGGGHAGIEAAAAAGRMGMKTGLISMDTGTIGRLSCNPSIGGSAKGHLAKEIDALGGVMGRLADASGIQFKMLNTSKGPAVWSPRSQNDKDLYPHFAQNLLFSIPNLTIVAETVDEVIVSGSTVKGVKTSSGAEIQAKTVILCSGTFLNAVMWTGQQGTEGGRVGEKPSNKISDLLASHGLEKGRLKTGTPPRISFSSVNLEGMVAHNGDDHPIPFSIQTDVVKNKLACFATHTTDQTHDILRSGFAESPMFSGKITGVGPRYCPSIEDKIDRFADKASHLIVLEPESLGSDSIYVNGFSTSLPAGIQQRALRTIPGLEEADILKMGYAVEYDFFYPYQLKFTMETKAIRGLFFAGQVNGTSGYEEAASQGLIAGINAARKVKGDPDFTLQRSEAYIGVLIDDLVNKNTEEPYRVFTSLAEYRLLLRIDTVYDRLLPYGYDMGLVTDRSRDKWLRSKRIDERIASFLDSQKVTPAEINPYLLSVNEDPIAEKVEVSQVVKRPTVSLRAVLDAVGTLPSSILDEHPDAVHRVQTQARYAGYIIKQQREVDRFKEYESKRIPDEFDYTRVNSLSTESVEKLSKIRPASLGQASRITGVSASDVSILAVYLR